MRVYLSGKMRGIEDLNRPMFHRTAKVLRILGYKVFSPAETWAGDDDLTIGQLLDMDVAMLKTAEALFLIPGDHRGSAGVRMETSVARFLGIPVLDYREWRETVLGGMRLEDLADMPWQNDVLHAVRMATEDQ